MKFSYTIIFVFALLFYSLPAHAAEPDFLKDDSRVVEKIMKIARKNITRAKMLDGSFVAEETEEELKAPIISLVEGKRVVNRGMLSAMAQYCGFDWENRSFLPFMEGERAGGKWTDKQLAYIGLVHGIAQGSFRKRLEKDGACTAEKKQAAEGLLAEIHKKAAKKANKPAPKPE